MTFDVPLELLSFENYVPGMTYDFKLTNCNFDNSLQVYISFSFSFSVECFENVISKVFNPLRNSISRTVKVIISLTYI